MWIKTDWELSEQASEASPFNGLQDITTNVS